MGNHSVYLSWSTNKLPRQEYHIIHLCCLLSSC